MQQRQMTTPIKADVTQPAIAIRKGKHTEVPPRQLQKK